MRIRFVPWHAYAICKARTLAIMATPHCQARMMVRLGRGHVNIVRPIEVVLTGKHVAFVSEYVNGGSVSDFLKKSKVRRARARPPASARQRLLAAPVPLGPCARAGPNLLCQPRCGVRRWTRTWRASCSGSCWTPSPSAITTRWERRTKLKCLGPISAARLCRESWGAFAARLQLMSWPGVPWSRAHTRDAPPLCGQIAYRDVKPANCMLTGPAWPPVLKLAGEEHLDWPDAQHRVLMSKICYLAGLQAINSPPSNPSALRREPCAIHT